MSHPLSKPLKLPCGAVLSNRLAKAAMSEGLADSSNQSSTRLETLYLRWANSGAGLLLSGNMQVDCMHLERPGNIVIDGRGQEQLARLAEAGKFYGAHFWAQISHTGRQVNRHINSAPLSPSAVDIDVIREAGFNFATPKPMTKWEIRNAIDQFIAGAKQVKEAGFTGLSLHAAHGYLISQFLSPLSNRRTDRWGGSLENRSRFLLEVIAGIREVVGPTFPIGIKLNASDFQKGGFTNAECVELVKLLNEVGLDLLELSGGSLEQPKVVGISMKDEGEDGPRASTVAREAYFVSFAGTVRQVAKMPVMVTGGFRTVAGMVEALENGELDIVGLGRPLIADPDCPRHLLAGEVERLPSPELTLNLFHILPWNNMQLGYMGDGLNPASSLRGDVALKKFIQIEGRNMANLLENPIYRMKKQLYFGEVVN